VRWLMVGDERSHQPSWSVFGPLISQRYRFSLFLPNVTPSISSSINNDGAAADNQ
jgi:hypothetical protein